MQLTSSQQSVYELTREVDQVHNLLSTKEADCTRLARELGASQVREAQEKSRFAQEFKRVRQEHDFVLSQKKDEVKYLHQA